MPTEEQIKKQQQNQVEIQLQDEHPGAEFCNILTISEVDGVLLLNFLNVIEKNGKVVAKVVLTPQHFKRVISTMQETQDKLDKKIEIIKK